MKNLFRYFIILALSLAALTSCGKGESKYRIGVSQCSADDWRNKMNDEIMREIMIHPEATVEILSADDSNEKQIADIRHFMDEGFDIIIAAPNEADAITPIISEAYDSGIPVIIFDRSVNGEKYTAAQGVDNEQLGMAAAGYAINLAGKDAKVLEIFGLAGSTPADGRHKGFVDKFGPVLASGQGYWNYDDALVTADSLLRLHPDADVIYAHNDRMAIAAAHVADSLGLDPYIIGIDAAPEIGIKAVANGIIDATFLYPTEGHRLIRTALAILEGRPYERNVKLPLASAVDSSNADILLVQNESLKAETTKMLTLKDQVDAFWRMHSAQTTLFYATIVIAVLLIGIVFLVLRMFWQQKRHRAALEHQNRELEHQRDVQAELNKQLEEATQSKLAFFTNVSHDLRTPLTLIAEPVGQLAKASNLTAEQSTLMKIADKNVRILRRLINQILDFRTYENGKLTLNLAETDLRKALSEWVGSFAGIARKRRITLTTDLGGEGALPVAIDAEKLERVFFNLIANAFRYTPDRGSVSVSCHDSADTVTITVADTGQGIAAEELPRIFDRFYQVDKVRPKGSGLGLTLAKAFVELHEGSLTVESEEGRGSAFTVTLPKRRTAAKSEPVQLIADTEVEAELSEVEPDETSFDPTKPLLLAIDDNADIRTMLRAILAGEYNVVTASSASNGIRLAAKYVPDLIICDVMMPGIDGLECTRRLKNELTTSHIPVLLLTACALDEQRADGYDSGADGYLAKPFSGDVLLARCRSLIENRKRLLSKSDGTIATPETGASQPQKPTSDGDLDNDFYRSFLEIVNRDISDPELNVDRLASTLGLGRSQFYRKIKALTGYSPVELLRKLRLEQARTLLASSEKTVSEIAYEVGFSTPAYFTKCYREAYGETPTALRDRLGAN